MQKTLTNTLATLLQRRSVPPASVLAEIERETVSGHHVMREKIYLDIGVVEVADKPEQIEIKPKADSCLAPLARAAAC